MKRLTKSWEESGDKHHCLTACAEKCVNDGRPSCYCDPITEVRLKLAAYEDTGLEPEELEELAQEKRGEQAEREKGCDACNLIYKLDGASYGTEDEIIDNRFCPECGKRLEVEKC